MAMTRGTALVATVARVVQLTGRQDLANLETDGELTLTDVLVTASDAIFDQLEANGVDPTALTNQLIYESAVAHHFHALLVLQNYIDPPAGRDAPEHAYQWSDPYLERRKPQYAPTGDEARNAAEGVIAVANFYKGLVFSNTEPLADVEDWLPGTNEQ